MWRGSSCWDVGGILRDSKESGWEGQNEDQKAENKVEMWTEATLGTVFTSRPKGVDSSHLTLGNYGEIYVKEQKKAKVVFFFTRFFILRVLRHLHLSDKDSPLTIFLPQVSSWGGSFP